MADNEADFDARMEVFDLHLKSGSLAQDINQCLLNFDFDKDKLLQAIDILETTLKKIKEIQ